MNYSSVVMINYVDHNNETNGIAKILLDSDSVEECISHLINYRKNNKLLFKMNGFNEMYGVNVDDENYENIHVTYELLVFDGTKYNKKTLYMDRYEDSDLTDFIGVCRYKLTTLVKASNNDLKQLIERDEQH